MKRACLLKPFALLLPTLLIPLIGCGGGGADSDADADGPVTWQMARDKAVTRKNPETGVEWTVWIRTDEGNGASAKRMVENVLSTNPDVAAMVGLYNYNPPAILQAVEARDKLEQIKIIGFDENELTLAAIKEDKIVGTIVQNPYMFGFRSVELLAAKVRGQEIDVPDNGLMYVDTRVITQENVDAFNSEVTNIREGNGPVPEYNADRDMSKRVNIHFVANLPDPFWKLANRGCDLAEEKFNAEVSFHEPERSSVALQKQYVEDKMSEIDGLAISVVNPAAQSELINDWAKQFAVIAVDSDAPESDRLFYLGTSNVAAGRQAGELIAKNVPEGGEVIIFVGPLTQANARERAQGVINALLGQD
ncbi:MAG: substrate-binding domain-containing protein [Planctomycetota bacterium]